MQFRFRCYRNPVRRVEMLLALNEAMQGIALGSVGEWMVRPNAGPVLGGSSPVDYLTRCGGSGYAALLRQARQWEGM